MNRHLYTDSKAVVQWVKNRWGIVYSPQGMVDLLNHIGFAYKQTKQVSCEANAAAQAIFMEDLSELLIQTVNQKNRCLLR